MQHDLRTSFALSLVAGFAAFVLPACAAESAIDGAGDTGELESALSASSCKLSRSAILASVTGARRTAIERGFGWYDAGVPYSQSALHASYRTDCSGFVSMCWQLGSSYTTAEFSTGGGQSEPIGSYANLLPGDALVRRANGSGHIVLFLGWSDASHSAACVLEEASTASDMQFRARTKASLTASGFKAIRADKLDSSGATAASPGADTSDPSDGTTDTSGTTDDTGSTGSSSAGGQKCTSTGQCNPGNNGAGLICVAGTCKPGCTSNAQCPGSTSCVGGQCR
jgi:hypothetical protein